VLPNTDEKGAGIIANRLLSRIRDCSIPHTSSDISDIVTVSIGGTTGLVNHLQEESDFIKCADIAMYQSKQNGRNQYTFKELKDSEQNLFKT